MDNHSEFSPSIPDIVHTKRKLEQEEHKQIMEHTQKDREWYPTDRLFFVREEATEGALIKVTPEGEHYKLIGRLCGPDKNGIPPEPDELSPKALSKLHEVTTMWAERLRQKGIDSDRVKLAVTSLYRDEKLQTALNHSEGSHLAAPPRVSSHLAGASFDIDPKGYYVMNAEGRYVNVHGTQDPFNPVVISTLHEVLSEQMREDKVNFVIENKVVAEGNDLKLMPSVYHVCVNPHV